MCYRLTNPAEFVYFSPRDHAVHYSSQRPCSTLFLPETMQYTIPLRDHAVNYSTLRPCSTLFHPGTMQYTIPLRDHAVHYSSQRPCSTLFLSETMQYTISLRDYVQYTIPPRDHAVHYSCNELCNHASNIWFIYIRLSILSYFMLNLTGQYGQFNFTCI